MIYDWNFKKSDVLNELRRLDLDFKVLNFERYDDQDYPYKENFRGHWRDWKGVEIDYQVENQLILGHRGKTVWYIPATTDQQASALKIEKGQALKIIKYLVKDTIEEEYERLLTEFAIQKTLNKFNLAPDIYETVLVTNGHENTVQWFDEMYTHPQDSIYLAQIVEHLETQTLPQEILMDEDFEYVGEPISTFKRACESIGIKHYDLGLGNLFCDKEGQLKVVDIHKWQWHYDLSVPSAPEYLQIELNNTCNATCNMCAIPLMKRKKGLMSDDLFVKILKEAQALGIENITPFLHGEPFLREDFIDKLKLINEIVPSAKISIFTNASRLTKEKVQDLKQIQNISRLNFSFPGGDEKTYKAVTGLDYNLSKANIEYALKELSCEMTITMAKFKENESSEIAFMALWADFKAHAYDAYDYIDRKIESNSESIHTPCDRILRSMTVLYDGVVNICCLDSEGTYELGNVNNDSLEGVWNGPQAKEYREKHLINRHYCLPCKGCNQELLPPFLSV